jgi:hypothetical protein
MMASTSATLGRSRLTQVLSRPSSPRRSACRMNLRSRILSIVHEGQEIRHHPRHQGCNHGFPGT